MALRPSYKGDIYCKWYVIMFGLWLFECFTPPLSFTVARNGLTARDVITIGVVGRRCYNPLLFHRFLWLVPLVCSVVSIRLVDSAWVALQVETPTRNIVLLQFRRPRGPAFPNSFGPHDVSTQYHLPAPSTRPFSPVLFLVTTMIHLGNFVARLLPQPGKKSTSWSHFEVVGSLLLASHSVSTDLVVISGFSQTVAGPVCVRLLHAAQFGS